MHLGVCSDSWGIGVCLSIGAKFNTLTISYPLEHCFLTQMLDLAKKIIYSEDVCYLDLAHWELLGNQGPTID